MPPAARLEVRGKDKPTLRSWVLLTVSLSDYGRDVLVEDAAAP
jgi:hypothetical protein